MKKRVLLVDESLTVQKVVALTLDKNRYAVSYAKTKPEAMKLVIEQTPDLILVSDQVPELQAASFPREVEAWLARRAPTPPCILITGQDLREMRHYVAVLKKPFSPQTLQSLVTEHGTVAPQPPPRPQLSQEEIEDHRLQKIFNDAFADEAKLVRETFENEELTAEMPRPLREEMQAARAPRSAPPPPTRLQPVPPPPAATGGRDLWGPSSVGASGGQEDVLGQADSMAYKAVLENQVQEKIEREDLEAIVAKVLDRMLPPIVEKLVEERLDRLMKEQEQFVDLKS